MGPLWECMQKNADYYTPQMDALQAGREPNGGEDGGGSPSGEAKAKPQTTSPSGQHGSPQSPASAAAAGPSQPFDFDKITAEDIEAYLEQLDKEESAGRK